MGIAGHILSSAAFIGAVVCFILVVAQMFKRGQSGMGIVCIVLLCCGVGGLVAFIYGWVKHREWGLTNVMIIWTVCIIVLGIGGALNPIDLTALRQQIRP
jgi:hypothetical protein